ncbi:hypothetical protein [Streptomyces bluensis]|uniref:hypothetical protein n=1 Tax=Streptomyces bluensis TaxID=33897 RepID=UPI0016769BCA|nr:hypothetical protein [Streptomyces bluensis]
MNSTAHYDRLLADLGLSIAATFTAICPADEDDVIRCFGGDPPRPGREWKSGHWARASRLSHAS